MVTMATLSAAPAYADVDDAVSTAVDSVKVRTRFVNCSLAAYRCEIPRARPLAVVLERDLVSIANFPVRARLHSID